MDMSQSITNQTAFSLGLAHHVSNFAGQTNSNMVFSPISLHVALSLVATGAKGSTLTQLLSFLNPGSNLTKSASDLNILSSQIVDLIMADGSGLGGPLLAFASGVWFDQTMILKDEFREIITKCYKAETKPVDFLNKADEVVSEVNSWINNITRGLITNLLAPGSVDHKTRLILSNAIYFKGSWLEKFVKSRTQNSEFYLLDGTTIRVPFMTNSKKQYVSYFNDFSVLKLPYNQGVDKRQFSMYIFLPHKSWISIPTLTKKMFNEPDFLTRHTPTNKISLRRFKIPRFKISFEFEGSEILRKLGLELPFSPHSELTEMVDSSTNENVCISKIFHKAFVGVNEEGTEAAAATATFCSMMAGTPPPPPKEEFVADRPFVFVIKEDITGVVLFVGHVLYPLDF